MKSATSLLCLALLTPALAHAQDKAATAAAQAEHHTYRLTYTLTEMDGGKKVGVQHFSLTANPGAETVSVKLGSKVPVGGDREFSYLDIGLNITATLTAHGDEFQVQTKVEQSSLEDSKNPSRPIIRQAVLQDNTTLQRGKSVQIGSLDVPGSTHHLDVEVVLERVP